MEVSADLTTLSSGCVVVLELGQAEPRELSKNRRPRYIIRTEGFRLILLHHNAPNSLSTTLLFLKLSRSSWAAFHSKVQIQ